MYVFETCFYSESHNSCAELVGESSGLWFDYTFASWFAWSMVKSQLGKNVAFKQQK